MEICVILNGLDVSVLSQVGVYFVCLSEKQKY